MSRCYVGDCQQPAGYEARLDWTEGLILLCEVDAIREREWASVRSIRRLRVYEESLLALPTPTGQED